LALYHQLVAENRHPVQSTRGTVPSARLLEEGDERRRQNTKPPTTPQKTLPVQTGIQITRTSRRGQTPVTQEPSSSASVDERDNASLVTAAAINAMSEEPLRHFTFEQQCLLLLAASRWVAPDVAVGPLFLPSVEGTANEEDAKVRVHRNTVNYWSAKAVAATLDPPPRGAHHNPLTEN
jgi:hypothetical protein